LSPKSHRSGASARLATAALTLALLGAPAVAPGVDRLRLTPELSVDEEYDSNVFNDDDRAESDLVTHLRPGLFLEHKGDLGALTGSFEFDTRFGSQRDDGVDRFLRLSGNRSLTPRLGISGGLGYSYFDDTSTGNPVPSDPNQPATTSDDQSFERIATSAGLTYSLGPRTSLGFGVDQVETQRSQSLPGQGGDSSSSSGHVSLIRQLSLRDSLGFSASLSESDFGRSQNIGANDSRTLSNRVSWDRSWTKIFTTSFSAGFSQVETGADTSVTLEADPLEIPDGFPPDTLILLDQPVPDTSSADTSTAFNGGLSLTWLLPRGVLQLDLSRDTSSRSGLGSEVNTDSISASFEHRLASRWVLSSDLGHARVKSAGETPVFFSDFYEPFVVLQDGQPTGQLALNPCGQYTRVTDGTRTGCVGISDNAIDYKSTWANLSLRRQMTKRMTGSLTYSYTQQSSSGDTEQADYDEHRVSVGLRYTYDIDLL
jgi:hypothetical protein